MPDPDEVCPPIPAASAESASPPGEVPRRITQYSSFEPGKRNLPIDVLRGVAILMVLVCHSVLLRQPTWDLVLWRPCWSGVDLFFVISGFLISGLLFGEYRKMGHIRFGRFAVRRALRIYPPLYTIVFLTVGMRLIASQGAVPKELFSQALHDVLFMQSYWPGTWGHFWSLSVEEHFYVALPVTLWFLLRRKNKANNPFQALPQLFVIVAILLLAARLLNSHLVKPFSWQTHLYPTHLRIDSLFFGVLLSYLVSFHGERFSITVQPNLKLILGVAILLLSPAFFVSQYDSWMYIYGFTFLYLGYGCLLVSFLYWKVDGLWPPVLLCFQALGYIGTFSYSIYLWHVFWLSVVQSCHFSNVGASLILFYTGSIALGILTGKLVEAPMMRIREKAFPRPSPSSNLRNPPSVPTFMGQLSGS
ncbi:MAG: acyltransferase [Bryobacteraceae bacterium]